MKSHIKIIAVLAVGASVAGCRINDKKPDAVVMSNEQVRDSLAANNIPAEEDSAYAVNEYESTVDTEPAADNGIGEESATGAVARTSGAIATQPGIAQNNTYQASATSSNAGQAEVNSAASNKAKATTGTKKVAKKLSVQQLIARDARMGKRMPLSRFGWYMTRRWAYYQKFGEVSYQDKTMEIKITDEELKIETPEGKFKRERDEMKLKTDAVKVKKETRS